MRCGRLPSSVGLSTRDSVDLPMFHRQVAKTLDSECERFSALVLYYTVDACVLTYVKIILFTLPNYKGHPGAKVSVITRVRHEKSRVNVRVSLRHYFAKLNFVRSRVKIISARQCSSKARTNYV